MRHDKAACRSSQATHRRVLAELTSLQREPVVGHREDVHRTGDRGTRVPTRGRPEPTLSAERLVNSLGCMSLSPMECVYPFGEIEERFSSTR